VKKFKEDLASMKDENKEDVASPKTPGARKFAVRKAAGKAKSAGKAKAGGDSAAREADAPTVGGPAGNEDSPIEINCQYPANPVSHGHATAPRFTIPSTAPSLALPESLPRPLYHYHQFLANHDCFGNAGLEQDSLFVTRSSASWMDAAARQGHGYHS
jgi:hypothetical protein